MTSQRDLEVPPSVAADLSTKEILRIWTSDHGEQVTLRVDLFEPAAWGLVLVDVAKHVTHAYARRGGMTANQAFSEVLSGFIAEIGQATDEPTPTESED
jgi:hypothetical protein